MSTELQQNGILNCSKEEVASLVEKYGLPSSYIKSIVREFGSIEEFLDKYKRGECTYHFGPKVFVGPQRVASVSSNPITQRQKKGYYDFLKSFKSSRLNEEDGSTFYCIDIDAIEHILSLLSKDGYGRNVECIRMYYGLNGRPPMTLVDIGNEYGMTASNVGIIIRKTKSLYNKKKRSAFAKTDPEIIEVPMEEIIDGSTESMYLDAINYFLYDEDIFRPTSIIPAIEREHGDSKREEVKYGLKLPIEALELSSHTFNWLKRAGKNTVEDIFKISKDENGKFTDIGLLKLRKFGRVALEELIDKLVKLEFLKKGSNGEIEFVDDSQGSSKDSTIFGLHGAGDTLGEDAVVVENDDLIKTNSGENIGDN